jgi:PhoPQ-activated pathogenicity-related protein
MYSLRMVAAITVSAMLFGSLPAGADDLPEKTALDDYVAQADDSYSWKIVRTDKADGMTMLVVDMTSQTWRTPEEVDRTKWQHWVTFCIPDKVTSDIGFLFIGGGANGREAPDGPDERVRQIARATGTVVAELKMVPNQPLVFHGDGVRRTEDDLIGYTWDQFLKTGDVTWPARNPMVKSAVRAMDTMTAVMNSEAGGGRTVDKFVVGGGSKRGWTTWLTGAVDKRVVGIVPIVIDVLNTSESMQHHFAAYGFWAPSVGDYVAHRIMERFDHPRMQDLYELVDPYYYRHRLKMPKLILNAAGDQFFLPDSSQFYWDDLQGPKALRYVPNTDHGLGRSDAVETIVAFYSLILRGKPLPVFAWEVGEGGEIRVRATDKPAEVRLWQATNPEARDFRLETLGPKYTSSVLEPGEDGTYAAAVDAPETGWTAYFVELTYDVGAPVPLKLTTGVRVTPDALPFADKDHTLPASVTIVCVAPDETTAQQALNDVLGFASENNLDKAGLLTERSQTRCYINWRPNGSASFEQEAAQLTKWLQDRGFQKFNYQLESGKGITLPLVR